MSEQQPQSQDHQSPPKTAWGILTRIGPGLIIAGSIVGSGELIATTKTGAEAGFWLLWLILIGCVIKVFVQVELGRYTLSSGETTMLAMNRLPGPRLKRRGNWVIWYWFIMFVASIAQLGGIVGGVGQALSISAPLTADARFYNHVAKQETRLKVDVAELKHALDREVKAGQGAKVDPSSDSFRATLRLLQDQYRAAETFNEHLLDLPPSAGAPATAAEQDSSDPLLGGQRTITERRGDLLALAQSLSLLYDRLVAYDNASKTAGGTANSPDENSIAGQETIGAAQSTGSPNNAWVETNLAILQRHLISLNDVEEVAAKVRAQRESYRAAVNNGDSEKIEQQRTELTGLLELEKELVADSLARDQQLGVGSGLSMTTAFLGYKAETELEPPMDDKIWAGIVAVITSLILINGRFGLIQSFSTAMVACFTLVTVVNLVLLNQHPSWTVSFQDIMDGMRFRLPPTDTDSSGSALSTALKTFGIIGVGATELVAYPYWCLEKGYARFTGPRDDSQAWLERAQGWMRVMRVDAWGSMIVYTFATIAFYLLGATVLGRIGLNPDGHNLVRYLAVMYEPVFGTTTEMLFLFGCFAVLYSTFFVANAGHARVFSDSLRLLGLISVSAKSYTFWVRFFSGLFPLLCLVVYIFFPKPAFLVLLSGLMQAIMLPMLAATALYLRYRVTDKRLAPSRVWDILLWVSSLGMLVAGTWAAWTEVSKLLG